MKPILDGMRDEGLVVRVRRALSEVHGVSEKMMFGSMGFMVRGKMCITARAERIMCRTDPKFHDTAIRRTGCSTVVMRKRPYRGYVYVAADALKTEEALKYWIRLAFEHNTAHEKQAR